MREQPIRIAAPVVPRKLKAMGVLLLSGFLFASGAGMSGCVGTIGAGGPPACGEELMVTKFEDTADGSCDSSDCSLREAVIAANRCPGRQQIRIGPGLYVLSIQGNGEDAALTGDLDITDDLDIIGEGAGGVTISGVSLDGALRDRIFHVVAGSVNMRHLSIIGGYATGAGNVPFADGGGMLNEGTVMLLDSTFDGNLANRYGAGLYNAHIAVLEGVTFSRNYGALGGGGLASEGASIDITNVTMSGNSASYGGGGLLVMGGRAWLRHVTIVDNVKEGIRVDPPTGFTAEVRLMQSILSSNPNGNCNGTVISTGFRTGYNLDRDGTCLLAGTGDITGLDPMLGPLDRNSPSGYPGGLTWTHALILGSPAIDAGGEDCWHEDQRGVPRPQGPICDIGAFEQEYVPLRLEATGSAIPPLNTPTPTATPVLPAAPLPLTPTLTRTPTPVTTAPNAPTNLTVASASCSAKAYTVTLQWTDNAKNETGYRVYRDGVLIATLPANSTGYTDSGPCCGPTKYAVEAYNSAGSSKRAEITAPECVY